MPAARADLSNIREFIREENPSAAKRYAQRLRDACLGIGDFPNRGQPGLVDGTREITTVWPYVIVYRVTSSEAQILRIWHGAQNRT